MFSKNDDYGNSYYYRGAVDGNIVKFGNYYWKVIRINGDGTIRMIFYGSSPNSVSSSDKVLTSFNYPKDGNNSQIYDPTYLGLMYNDDEFSEEPNTSNNTTFTIQDDSTSIYNVSKSYTWNKSTNLFTLDTTDGNSLEGKYLEVKDKIYTERYIYSCGGNGGSSCNKLYRLNRDERITDSNTKVESTKVYVTRLINGSTSYENATKNIKKSNILIKLDEWYETHIKDQIDSNNNLLSDYLDDRLFCNDRSYYSGNGYFTYNASTYYSTHNRLNNRRPNLICTNNNDKFTKNAANGNGDLEYSIGLITSDEAMLSGMINSSTYSNKLSYLYWNGNTFWTISPYYSYGTNEHIYSISNSGYIDYSGKVNNYGMRPVINLKANTKIVRGEGTKDNPFEIALGN